jgi:tetratricopeptide (TPR) repeat protein
MAVDAFVKNPPLVGKGLNIKWELAYFGKNRLTYKEGTRGRLNPKDMLRCVARALAIFVSLQSAGVEASAQPGTRIDLPKPEKYQNRVLASEKSTTGRFGVMKRFSQNIGTRYNYVFNAGRELEEVVAAARQSNRDNFTRRLSFYDASLTTTSAQKSELDSVILKCNNGILLHDLRNDWIDDLYLLMGQAYYYRNDLDSAVIAFQYINQAFQPREKDEIGFDKSIGSRFNTGGNSFTVASPEKKGPSALVSHKPARNEALLWLCRSLIARGDMDDARGLLETLRRDRNMPPRLRSELSEVEALWYYNSGMPDSAAVHLEMAMEAASDNRERARWEYLNAQLYQASGRDDKAARLYESVIRLTTDPVMEAYARIQRIGLYGASGDTARVKEGFKELLGMAEKAKYEEYRHLIFHAAARIQEDLGNLPAAVRYLQSSLKANQSDPKHKNEVFLELGDIAYRTRDYRLSLNSYDSASLDDLAPGKKSEVTYRKGILSDIVYHLDRVQREDSLQRIAAMPEAKREEFLKGMIRKWRKEQGIKEDASTTTSGSQMSSLARDAQPVDIFEANESNGEWYFYNAGLKTQGFRQFQSKWGKRPNLDNWRRISAVNSQLNASSASSGMALDAPDKSMDRGKADKQVSGEMTMEGLLADLPLTEEQMRTSNDSIQASLFALGKIFHDRLDDCGETILHLESLIDRYPKTVYLEQSLFMLSRCQAKSGNKAKAEAYKGHLEREYPGSRSVRYLKDPEGEGRKERQAAEQATQSYEEVYTKVSEGRYDEARVLKQRLDSSRGETPWSPQLLYIDAALNAKEGKDSLALVALDKLIKLYPESEVTSKAKTLQDVLRRRTEIESELARMKVTRDTSEGLSRALSAAPAGVENKSKSPQAAAPASEPPKSVEKKTDTAATAAVIPAPTTATPIPPKPDSVAVTVPKKPEPTPQTAPPPPPAPPPAKNSRGFVFEPQASHGVALLLEKADIAYVSEARYSLNRYNGRNHPTLGLEVEKISVSKELDIVLVKSFPNLSNAMEYLETVRTEARKTIIPWMPATMYTLAPVTEANLEVLKRDQNLPAYLAFIRDNLPGKF